MDKKIRDNEQSILDDVANGKNIKDILSELGIKINDFFTYLRKHTDYEQKFTFARRAKVEGMADDIIGIADFEIDPHRARNMIDARKWYAQKMFPGKFGDKVDVTINAKIDISAALNEAHSRVSLDRHEMVRDVIQLPIEIAKPIEPASLDHESSEGCVIKNSDDIFN